MKTIELLEKWGFVFEVKGDAIHYQHSGKNISEAARRLLDELKRNKAEAIHYLQHRGVWRHKPTGWILKYEGRRPGYKIMPGQEHLLPPPMMYIFTILEGEKMGQTWTYTEIQFNELLEKAAK